MKAISALPGVHQKTDDPAEAGGMQPTDRPRKGTSLLQRDLRDGSVLHDQRTGLVCTLNSSASFILTFCTGDYQLSQIADETATAFGLRPADALRDVISTVQALRNAGILEPVNCGHGQDLL